MFDPPHDLTDAEVLACVQENWASEATAAAYQPVGFGAHHWRVTGPGVDLFVTVDDLFPRHSRASLEGAYATAVDLAAQGLEFVLAGQTSQSGTMMVPLGDRAASAVGWQNGATGHGPFASESQASAWAARLARLHTAQAPGELPRWSPQVPTDLADRLARAVASPWPEPLGETARAAVADHMAAIERWAATYHRQARDCDPATWTVTHGEPHTRNILKTARAEFLVDWESVKLAPRERDFAPLLEAGLAWLPAYDGGTPDWQTVEMFDLEWRLDEIHQYAAWFRAPHAGNSSDHEALKGLQEELARPDWRAPGTADPA